MKFFKFPLSVRVVFMKRGEQKGVSRTEATLGSLVLDTIPPSSESLELTGMPVRNGRRM